MRLRRSGVLISLLVWASWPGRACAHLVNSGLGPFYDGIAHPFATPEDVLTVIALALLAGLAGKQQSRALLFLLPMAWVGGALVGRMNTVVPLAVSAVLLIAVGALVAADRPWRVTFVIAVGLGCGLLSGLRNGAAVGYGATSLISIAGTGCAVFVLVALISGQVASIHKDWGRIVVRIGGSWIAAIGLLMLGWALR